MSAVMGHLVATMNLTGGDGSTSSWESVLDERAFVEFAVPDPARVHPSALPIPTLHIASQNTAIPSTVSKRTDDEMHSTSNDNLLHATS